MANPAHAKVLAAVNTAAPDFAKTVRHLTDLGNAERLYDQHGQDLRYCKQFGRMIWTGTHWERDDRLEWERRAAKTVRTIYDEIAISNDLGGAL